MLIEEIVGVRSGKAGNVKWSITLIIILLYESFYMLGTISVDELHLQNDLQNSPEVGLYGNYKFWTILWRNFKEFR